MGEIINLRRARKSRARDEAARKGAVNRALFGQTKAEKQQRKLEAERAAAAHDSQKIEDGDEIR